MGERMMRAYMSAFFILALAGVLFSPVGTAAAGDPVVSFYGAPETGGAPLEVHFHPIGDDAIIQAATGWSWDFGDGSSSTEGYTTHEYAQPGTYTVTLKVTLSNGSTSTEIKQDYVRVTSGDAGEAPAETAQEQMTEEATPSEAPAETPAQAEPEPSGGGDNLVFIHHSCGENWLNSGLHDALLAKDYFNERNDITYGVDVAADPGRPDSLGPVPGELTDMNHWILWLNDYLGNVRRHGCASGVNRIVLYKSCFPNSHIDDEGTEPGDPFSDWKTVANYKAVYRHPDGAGNSYHHDGATYRPLEDIFAANPNTLFVIVTAPPECWNDTNREIAGRARAFNKWLTEEWLPRYLSSTGLHNVAVFDWFNVLASPASDSSHPNQLRGEYGGGAGDSHPNDTANHRSIQIFASGADNFLDGAWEAFRDER